MPIVVLDFGRRQEEDNSWPCGGGRHESDGEQLHLDASALRGRTRDAISSDDFERVCMGGVRDAGPRGITRLGPWSRRMDVM